MQKKELYFKCSLCGEIISYQDLVEESISKVKVEQINHVTGEKSTKIYTNKNCEKLSELLLRKCSRCNHVGNYVRERSESNINAYLAKKQV